jgi:hypothetical protein
MHTFAKSTKDQIDEYLKEEQMAGKAKSVYLTINPKGTFKTSFHKVFFNAKDYNEYVKTDEFKAKWPEDEYTIVKEVY